MKELKEIGEIKIGPLIHEHQLKDFDWWEKVEAWNTRKETGSAKLISDIKEILLNGKPNYRLSAIEQTIEEWENK